MYTLVLFASVFINFINAYESQSHNVEDNSKSVGVTENKNNHGMSNIPPWQQHFWKPPHRSKGNLTYIDKTENLIRLPEISKYYEETKARKTINKKYPKRTIQKIIKKNGAKTKKIYLKPTSQSTMKPKINYDNYYEREEAQWKNDASTVPPKQKKRSRKWNTKMARNPMPFHKIHKNNKRDRREAKDDLYILKDFDEMKFIKGGKDYSIVNAHVKKYW